MKLRKQDALGNPIGEEHINPILDTRVYELESPDERVDEYAVNIIIENIIDHNDDQGWYTEILEEMVAFRHDPDVAIMTGDQAYKIFNGTQRPFINTKGWDVQFKRRDKSTDWVPLNIFKE